MLRTQDNTQRAGWQRTGWQPAAEPSVPHHHQVNTQTGNHLPTAPRNNSPAAPTAPNQVPSVVQYPGFDISEVYQAFARAATYPMFEHAGLALDEDGFMLGGGGADEAAVDGGGIPPQEPAEHDALRLPSQSPAFSAALATVGSPDSTTDLSQFSEDGTGLVDSAADGNNLAPTPSGGNHGASTPSDGGDSTDSNKTLVYFSDSEYIASPIESPNSQARWHAGAAAYVRGDFVAVNALRANVARAAAVQEAALHAATVHAAALLWATIQAAQRAFFSTSFPTQDAGGIPSPPPGQLGDNGGGAAPAPPPLAHARPVFPRVAEVPRPDARVPARERTTPLPGLRLDTTTVEVVLDTPRPVGPVHRVAGVSRPQPLAQPARVAVRPSVAASLVAQMAERHNAVAGPGPSTMHNRQRREFSSARGGSHAPLVAPAPAVAAVVPADIDFAAAGQIAATMPVPDFEGLLALRPEPPAPSTRAVNQPAVFVGLGPGGVVTRLAEASGQPAPQRARMGQGDDAPDGHERGRTASRSAEE
ncbi:uncharacterized protein LOC62_01G000824 [Vanrija pseudolonga]|uniref:Uncharacterized protein n=1 Tax=Vanrija pseudolonga TaxID=143232 RepID=A0AAF1BFC3_9TREE|nr:hypothetical protein LOC62_01G000824 [Vanrija pseudolonga]